MSEFYKQLSEGVDLEDKLYAYGLITASSNSQDRYQARQLVKQSSASYIIPTALGLGAAGTAAYIGTKDADAKARLKVLRSIKDKDKRKLAETEVDSKKYTKAGATALGAGLGAMYLTGSHAAEDAIKNPGTIGKMTTKQKIMHAPGTGFQKLLRKGGASVTQGKGIAGALVLGSGALAGKYMGDKIGDEAIKNATEGMPKSAGLFLKPSDVANHHHDLSAALEGRLNNGDDSKQFKKQAMPMRAKSALGGAGIGAVYEPLRQKLTQPLKEPPPEEPKGLTGRISKSVQKARYTSDKYRRDHPVTAAVTSAVIGAGVGASTNFAKSLSELNKTRLGKV